VLTLAAPQHPAPSLDDTWGVRHVLRLDFPDHSALARDPAHRDRLTVYLSDLLRPFGLPFHPEALHAGGQSYGEMAEALITRAVPEGEAIDLLVLAYAIPDITPGRATATYLSHVCPGNPLAFAVSDQGADVAATALRLIRIYTATAGLRRCLLLTTEQSLLPYDPGVPVTVPSTSSGVAVLFGHRASPQSQS
jgi:hypothetical protein